MKAAIFSIAAAAMLASTATAATPTAAAAAATSTCLADYIVQTCLGTENDKLSACATTDYACQCAAYEAIVTCYNNCPDDPAKSTMAGQVTVFCGLAKQYASSSTTLAATASGSAGALETAAASTTTSPSGTATGTSAASTATESTGSNGGAQLALNAGGLLAAVAGVVAAVL